MRIYIYTYLLTQVCLHIQHICIYILYILCNIHKYVYMDRAEHVLDSIMRVNPAYIYTHFKYVYKYIRVCIQHTCKYAMNMNV